MINAYGDALMGEPDGQPDVCVEEKPSGDLSGAAGDPPPADEAEAMDAETGGGAVEDGRRSPSATRRPAGDTIPGAAGQEAAPPGSVQESQGGVTGEAREALESALADEALRSRARIKFGGGPGLPPVRAGPKAADKPTVGM